MRACRCNVSVEEVMNFWISGEHFQCRRLGDGNSLTLAARTNFEGLPFLKVIHTYSSIDFSITLEVKVIQNLAVSGSQLQTLQNVIITCLLLKQALMIDPISR